MRALKVLFNPDTNRDEVVDMGLCPACGGTGKASVDENGDVLKENPNNLNCGWCLGSGIANHA